MAVKLNLNTQTITTLNNDVKASGESIDLLLNNIVSACNTLDSYIDSTDIQNVLRSVIEKVDTMRVSINNNIEGLSDFLSSQLVSYERLLEDATRMLRGALDFINENFNQNVMV